jgi:transcriptional regulator with XRE-family HTH domain
VARRDRLPGEWATPAGAPAGAADVGALLRAWRERRRYSQLALALHADVSARHLSFVETGRARPSREMLLRLAERLEIPLRARNALLLAAGFAPEFAERPLDAEALREVRAAVDLLLAALAPCPALAVDRHWTLVAANDATAWMLAGIAPELLRPPVNVLRVSLHPRGLAPRIENLDEWRAHVLARLRRDAELTADPALAELLAELRAYPPHGDGRERPRDGRRVLSHGEDHAPVVIPCRIRTDAGVLAFVSTTTVFGTALDVTASELAVEAFLPADARTAEALRRLAGGGGTAG